MSYMFLCPLILGMLFYGAFILVPKSKDISRFSFNLYNSGVATLTLGGMLMGIFQIAGTDSHYVIVYGILGGIMLATGVATYFLRG
ncbi:MAG: hypothetical protein AB9836_05790 [Aminipila sp.]